MLRKEDKKKLDPDKKYFLIWGLGVYAVGISCVVLFLLQFPSVACYPELSPRSNESLKLKELLAIMRDTKTVVVAIAKCQARQIRLWLTAVGYHNREQKTLCGCLSQSQPRPGAHVRSCGINRMADQG